MFTYFYDDIYTIMCKWNVYKFSQSGIADTVTFLLSSHAPDQREMVNQSLKPFLCVILSFYIFVLFCFLFIFDIVILFDSVTYWRFNIFGLMGRA